MCFMCTGVVKCVLTVFRVEEGLMEMAQLKERELRAHMEIHSLKVPTLDWA